MRNLSVWFYREEWDGGPVYHVCGKTYHIKDQLKSLGARWDQARKRWTLPAFEENLEGLRKLGAVLMVKVVREAFCHEDAASIYVTSYEADQGEILGGFCGNCDSRYGPPIPVHREEEQTDEPASEVL